MKNTVIALFMALTVSFAACKKDENGGGGGTNPPESAKLEGTWKLNNWQDLAGEDAFDDEELDGMDYTVEMKMVLTGTTYSMHMKMTIILPPPLPPIEQENIGSEGTYVRNGNILILTDEDGETDEATILELTSTKLKLEVDSEDEDGNPEKVVLDFTRQ